MARCGWPRATRGRGGGDGRDRLELSLPSGRHYIVPLTTGRNMVVAGNTAEVELVDPVSGLTGDRLGDQARLAWEWPAGATDVVVRWAGGEQCFARHVYVDQGVTIAIGPAETRIEVRARYPHRDGLLAASPVTTTVPARGVAVDYRIRRGARGARGRGRGRRWRRTIEFISERATQLPAIVIVQATTTYRPGDPSEGETLQRVEPQPVTPEQPVTVPVSAHRVPGWLACFPDPADPDADTVLLFPPPDDEMRLP